MKRLNNMRGASRNGKQALYESIMSKVSRVVMNALNESDSTSSTRGMFAHNKSFNEPIDDLDTSHVTDMSEMFYRAESFNQPLDHLNVSNVRDISYMFYGAISMDHEYILDFIENVIDNAHGEVSHVNVTDDRRLQNQIDKMFAEAGM